MPTVQSPKASPGRPRTRKSIAHFPLHDSSTDVEKENTEELLSNAATISKPVKKTRSKSFGPGGLEALKEETGNRQKPRVLPAVRSILKPTIPLSPPKQIPPHSRKQKGSPGKIKQPISPKKMADDDLLIDISIPSEAPHQSRLENVLNPFQEPMATEEKPSLEMRVAVRTAEQQEAAAKEQERRMLLERRDARRKSLANRRVSFAPEATLHTWDVIELAEDATTSSQATDSTRRASAASNQAATSNSQEARQDLMLGVAEPPSTPPEQIEEVQVSASPAHQRDVHQKKRRRRSEIPPMNFNNPDDCSSSPSSSVADETEIQTLVSADGDSNSTDSIDDESTDGDEIVNALESEEITEQSIASIHSSIGSSTSSSARLEAALRQAAQQAGTQGIDYDENGDLTMEMADEEITSSFKPWAKKDACQPIGAKALSSRQDQENLNPFSPAFKANLDSVSNIPDDQEQTMEFTYAAGTILPAMLDSQASPKRGRRKSGPSTRRRSSGGRHLSGDSSIAADETMELTTAVGGIQSIQQQSLIKESESGLADNDEDLTMEFTTVLGGVLGTKSEQQSSKRSSDTEGRDIISQQRLEDDHRRNSISSAIDEEDMDMTLGVGGILETITEHTEPDEDQTYEMDITTAIGAILPEELNTSDKSIAKEIMEREADSDQLIISPFRTEYAAPRPKSVRKSTTPKRTTTSETGSPSMRDIQTKHRTRQSQNARLSITPNSTPLKKPSTPSKQLTPKPSRPTTPGKTPPSKNVVLRTGSPKKLFKADIKRSGGTPKLLPRGLSFEADTKGRGVLPNIILTPQPRRPSGLGIDKEGLGSPRLAALLDRRGSIGDNAETFTPQDPLALGVRFEDPRAMEQDLEKDRIEDEKRESGKASLQLEADMQDLEEEKDVTANLKDKIESLTPKKKLKGRKSLAIGGARGLLGKRPVELDEDEEEDEPTPKRLKGRESSPVKSIRLPAPPSKAETTGKMLKAPRFSLSVTDGNAQLTTPTAQGFSTSTDKFTTPKNQARFKDAAISFDAAKPPTPFNQKLAGIAPDFLELPEEDDHIHLQDFLNMTSIRFMELTTTKRRHTVVPNALQDDTIGLDAPTGKSILENENYELENCVVAGICTVPMLELYQHSCRELKKYISEGRSMVREIEADTFEENPPLFQEYISAAPDIKAIMDSQFRDVKTHSRLLSRAMWYEWRSKLLDSLKEGLLRINEGLHKDEEVLAQQEHILEPVIPQLVEDQRRLAADAKLLQAHADEIANCDQGELNDARQQLDKAEKDLEAKKRMIADLQQQLREQEESIEYVVERKRECLQEIKDAEKVCEEYHGWSVSEVATLKAKVDALEQSHGWSITSVSGSSLTLIYRNTLQLFLTPSSFKGPNATRLPLLPSSKDNSPISLSYIADSPSHLPPPTLSTEKRFFLQIMRAHLQFLPQSRTSITEVLRFVSATWECACRVSEETRLLGLTYLTEPAIKADEILAVTSCVLLRELRTKVAVTFEVHVAASESREIEGEGGRKEMAGLVDEEVKMDVGIREVKATAQVVYGEGFNEGKMREFLRGRVGGKQLVKGELKGKGKGIGVWAEAVRDLEGKLKRGRNKAG